MESINQFLLGAIAMTSITAGLFFLRFWKNTRDRLFLLFGLAFLIEGLNRTAFALLSHSQEGDALFYLIRMLAFGLILLAIVGKNLQRD